MAARVEHDGIDCDWRRRPSYAYVTDDRAQGRGGGARRPPRPGCPPRSSRRPPLPVPGRRRRALRRPGRVPRPQVPARRSAPRLTEVYERSHAVDVDVDEPLRGQDARRPRRPPTASSSPRTTRSSTARSRSPACTRSAPTRCLPHRRRAAARACTSPATPPTRSIRAVPVGGEEKLLVGGEGHRTGEGGDTEERYAALRGVRARALGRALGRLPLVEPGQHDHRHAALRRPDDAVRRPAADGHRLREVGHDRRHRGRADPRRRAARAARTRGRRCSTPTASSRAPPRRASSRRTPKVGLHFVGDRLKHRGTRPIEDLAPGEGDIVRHAGEKVAGYRGDDGTLVAVSPLCTHLGCQVNWNTAERSWDCPCHGSRFAPTATSSRARPSTGSSTSRSSSPRALRGRRRRMSKLRGTRIAAVLTCAAALFAGCGDDSSDSRRRRRHRGQKISGAKVIDPGSMDGAKGNVSFCTGKDTSGSKTAGVEGLQQGQPRHQRSSSSSSRSPPTSSATSSSSARRPSPPTATSSTPTSSGPRSSRSRSGCYDMTPYVESAQGRVHPLDVRDDHLPGQALGRPAQDQRRLPLLPHRSGRQGAGDLAGGLRRRGQAGRHRLPGRRPTRA